MNMYVYVVQFNCPPVGVKSLAEIYSRFKVTCPSYHPCDVFEFFLPQKRGLQRSVIAMPNYIPGLRFHFYVSLVHFGKFWASIR
jgi:hypothetical protein